MAKKKKPRAPRIIKFGLIVCLVGGIGFVLANRSVYLLRNADYFKVRSVIIDPALQFINKRDLKGMVGQNIFQIDSKAVQRRLSRKYPQASHVKITKQFPDQISIEAKERKPFIGVHIQDKKVTLDNQGVILSIDGKKNSDLPAVVGIHLNRPKLIVGLPLMHSKIRLGLRIVKFFEGNKSLSPYSIAQIDMENLSKIYLTLTNDLEVMIDGDNLSQKVRVLGVVLSSGKLNLKTVKYVDLRFKEPVIGKK